MMVDPIQAAQKVAEEMGLDQEERPPAWIPEPDDLLVGEVVSLQKGWSNQSEEYYPILVVRPKETEELVSVHAFRFILKDRLMTLRPQPGEIIGIRFKGMSETKSKRPLALYSVAIEGRSVDIYSQIDDPRRPTRKSSKTPLVDQQELTEEEDDDIPF